MPRDNIVTKTLNPEKSVKHAHSVWIEGRWIYYAPTFLPTPEVQEWGGRWDKKKQAWRLPRLTRYVRKIVDYDEDATLSVDAQRWGTGEAWNVTADFAREQLDWDRHEGRKRAKQIIEAKGRPFWDPDYQPQAVWAMTHRPFHGIMSILSPGLGKTPISILASDYLARKKNKPIRVLVVAVLSLLDNWAEEIETWSEDPRYEICHGLSPSADHSVVFTITNPETLMERVQDPTTGRWSASGNLDDEWDFEWDATILDESVLYKNRKSKRSSMARTLTRCSDIVWELSGAPTTRNNSDAWQQLALAEPDYFTAFWRFTNESCIVVRTQWSQGEIIGDRKEFSMRDEYPELMFVRNQEEVFDDLPEILYKDVPLKLHAKQQKAHDDIITDWIHELEENRDKRVEVTAVIAMLTRLQQVTSNLYNLETTGTSWPDYSAKADFVEETLDTGSDIEWPVLIWMHHRPGARALYDRLQKKAKKKDSALYGKRIELVYGGVKNLSQIVKDFKMGKVDVLLFGISVGKYGHTLSRAHTVITYDKTWDSDAWFQVLHRVGGARAKLMGDMHRVLVINPRSRGTVDDFVELNLAGKLPSMAKITGANLAKILRSLGEERVIA